MTITSMNQLGVELYTENTSNISLKNSLLKLDKNLRTVSDSWNILGKNS